MADDETSNPFLPPSDGEPARSTPEPETDPGLNLQGDGYRPMSYDMRRKGPPFQWKPFLLWMAFGLTALWAFALVVVWSAFQMLDTGDSKTTLAIAGVLAVACLFLYRLAMQKR